MVKKRKESTGDGGEEKSLQEKFREQSLKSHKNGICVARKRAGPWPCRVTENHGYGKRRGDFEKEERGQQVAEDVPENIRSSGRGSEPWARGGVQSNVGTGSPLNKPGANTEGERKIAL